MPSACCFALADWFFEREAANETRLGDFPLGFYNTFSN
jgi:hypothetical protein